MSVSAATLDLGLPNPEELITLAEEKMKEAALSHRIEHIHYKAKTNA